MWTLAQLDEALQTFKLIQKAAKLEVWFSDRGFCVFGALTPEELEQNPAHVPILAKLQDLAWSYQRDPDYFGDVCWYLFRSD